MCFWGWNILHVIVFGQGEPWGFRYNRVGALWYKSDEFTRVLLRIFFVNVMAVGFAYVAKCFTTQKQLLCILPFRTGSSASSRRSTFSPSGAPLAASCSPREWEAHARATRAALSDHIHLLRELRNPATTVVVEARDEVVQEVTMVWAYMHQKGRSRTCSRRRSTAAR